MHGLPISVKEHIGMKGLDLNTGFIAWVGQKSGDDALVLKILWKAGCVFYVRTTEPQTLVCLNCACMFSLFLEHARFTRIFDSVLSYSAFYD